MALGGPLGQREAHSLDRPASARRRNFFAKGAHTSERGHAARSGPPVDCAHNV